MNPVLGQVASAAVPYVAQAVGGMFNNPYYGTSQAGQAMRSDTGYTGSKTREQLEYEEQMRQQRAGFDRTGFRSDARFMGDMSNAAANANTARGMASAAQGALNDVYARAGDRLNMAQQNTMQAMNNAAQIAAGMFR